MTAATVALEVLDKSFLLDEFELSKIDPLLFKWELGGLTDPVGQLINWLWNNIQEAFSGLSNDIWGWLNTVKSDIISTLGASISGLGNALSTAITGIESAINNLSTNISSIISSIGTELQTLETSITQIGANLTGIAENIISGVRGIVGGLVNEVQELSTSLSSLLQGVVNDLSALSSHIYNYLDSFGQTIFGYIKELWDDISEGFKELGTVISRIENVISAAEKELFNAITSVGKTVTGSINDFYKFLSGFEKELVNAIEGLPKLITTSFEDFEKWLHGAFTTVATQLGQFGLELISFSKMVIKVFGQIEAAIESLGSQIVEGVTSTWIRVKDFLQSEYEALQNGVNEVKVTLSGFINPLVEIKNWIYSKFQVAIDYLSNTFDKLKSVGSEFWGSLQLLASNVWNGVSGFIGWIQGVATNAISSASSMLFGLITNCIESSFKEMSNRIKKLPEGVGEVDILSYVAQGYSIEVAKQMAAAVAAEAAGEAVGDQEIDAAPLGVGGKVKLKLGAFLKQISKYIKEVAVDTTKFAFGAFSFWIIEPVKYYARKILRNYLPVELPSLSELIEFARRHMPTKRFNEFISKAKDALELRGYNDWVIAAMLESAKTESVKVKDRFGKERTFPVSLLYELPSHSELCRMMMHDIIINVDDFTNAMEMAGVHPDIAFLFYLLHFRYMPLDRLWEFYCRGKAEMLKLDKTFLTDSEKQMIQKGLGYSPATPASFNGKNAEKLLPLLALYAKWHNYSFFAWEDGLPSDRLMALELLAKIPERIDSRWLYRWGIITDQEVMKIIIARGYHQDWIEPLTKAECLNALSEERNLARTGVIDAYLRGFLKSDNVSKLLSGLVKVKILGDEVPVKFLPGEIELLTLRGKYDRAIKLLDSLSYSLVDGYKENILSWETVTKLLEKTTKELGKGLGITLDFDANYYSLYHSVAQNMKTIYTIKRIRYWLRYLLMEIIRRFEQGYLTEQELNSIISDIQKWAAMTDEEKEALEDIAKMMLSLFNREIEAKAILKRLSRGVIDINKAKQELIKLGLNEKAAEAMIDYYARTYTLTPTSLIELSEYVPVPESELKEKISIMGMPPDEAKLYPAYAFARQVASYIRRMVSELIDDYADGIINEQELKRELDNLATMNGQVKSKFNVDWIVLSPEERKLIVELAKLRRERKLKRRKSGG